MQVRAFERYSPLKPPFLNLRLLFRILDTPLVADTLNLQNRMYFWVENFKMSLSRTEIYIYYFIFIIHAPKRVRKIPIFL